MIPLTFRNLCNPESVGINAEDIVCWYPTEDGYGGRGGTKIELRNGSAFSVRESEEKVKQMILTAFGKES
jgi:hypothetical protein